MNNEVKVSSYMRGATKTQIIGLYKVAFYLKSSTGEKNQFLFASANENMDSRCMSFLGGDQ